MEAESWAWAWAWGLLPAHVGGGSPAVGPRRVEGHSLEAAAAPERGQWSLWRRQSQKKEAPLCHSVASLGACSTHTTSQSGTRRHLLRAECANEMLQH